MIALWTKGFSEEMKKHVPLSCAGISYHAEVNEGEDHGETIRELYKAAGTYKIVSCIAGGEAGVDAADVLSERLMVRTNGASGVFANRRDKKVQQELIRDFGLRSVRQAAGKTFSDVEEFLRKERCVHVVDSLGVDHEYLIRIIRFLQLSGCPQAYGFCGVRWG